MGYIEKLNAIIKNLEKCQSGTKYSTVEENQADTLANSFLDIEEALNIIRDQIPKFYLNHLDASEVDDLIFDVGEELRHILYHIYSTKVYDYLREDKI